MKLAILTGMPASGKSTLAAKISKRFGLPILEKDALKEELFDTLGFENYPRKRQLDHAANAIVLKAAESLMKANVSLLIDNNFDTQSAERLDQLLEKYSCDAITLFLGGNADVFYERYVERDVRHMRHLGHVLQDHYPPKEGESHDYTMPRDEFAEKFEKRGMGSFKCRGERIDIDATYPEKVDVDAVLDRLAAFMNE